MEELSYEPKAISSIPVKNDPVPLSSGENPVQPHAARYRTHQEAMADLFEYVEVFYNRNRRHSSLGFASPVQFLQDWIKGQQTRDVAA